jgi:hypothetical protein
LARHRYCTDLQRHWFILLAAQAGEARTPFGGTVWTVLRHTTVGHAWLVRLVPAALLAVALWRISPTDSGVSPWLVAAFLAVAYALAALGTTQPASHVQPIWPFALRYSDAAFGDPQLREKLLFALWTIAGGAVLAAASVVVGLFMRRLRCWLIATGGGIAVAGVIWVAPTLSVLAVEAIRPHSTFRRRAIPPLRLYMAPSCLRSIAPPAMAGKAVAMGRPGGSSG